jgi:hypothetical protein
MLLQYNRQLLTARRLTRLSQGNAGRIPGVERESAPAAKRRIMVEHVARELLDNLLYTGGANPVGEEVRRELDRQLKGQYTFRYPPDEVDVQISRESPDGPRELRGEERRRVLAALWDITLAKVDATML